MKAKNVGPFSTHLICDLRVLPNSRVGNLQVYRGMLSPHPTLETLMFINSEYPYHPCKAHNIYHWHEPNKCMQIKQMWYPIRGNEWYHDVLEKEASSFNVGQLFVLVHSSINIYIDTVSTVSKEGPKSWFHPEPGITAQKPSLQRPGRCHKDDKHRRDNHQTSQGTPLTIVLN